MSSAEVASGSHAGAIVARYLDGLARHDWDALAATLAPDVVRMGPYRDEYRGRDDYVAFLRAAVTPLGGYELSIGTVHDAGRTIVVELTETVDDGDARLRTDEAVVFEVGDAGIARVAVYLQTSQRLPA